MASHAKAPRTFAQTFAHAQRASDYGVTTEVLGTPATYEWRSQKPLSSRTCGFESRPGHSNSGCSLPGATLAEGR
jgi:hypothetical protein